MLSCLCRVERESAESGQGTKHKSDPCNLISIYQKSLMSGQSRGLEERRKGRQAGKH